MESDFKEHPKTRAPTDFWGQVKRTVNGRPVSDDQIAMIVDAIRAGLELSPTDGLLDLACGNGALSRYFFDQCDTFLGVDFSEPLIDTAKTYFESSTKQFVLSDVGAYVAAEPAPERFTKVLCYGGFSYFSQTMAQAVLSRLATHFPRVQRVYIGNLPDRDLYPQFYSPPLQDLAQLDDPDSKIGIWRTEQAFIALGQACGWDVSFVRMPAAFYAAHYRYDVLLTRPAS